MQSFVSLWSADLLSVGDSLDLVEKQVDGFHIDVMDGHYVPDVLFGPDFVAAVCRRTRRPVEVHLMVTDADQWIEPFATTGCARLAFHLDSTASVSATIKKITQGGMKAGIALKLDDAVEGVEPYAAEVDRVLVMGTALGIKGVEPDLRACEHVKGTVALRNRCQCSFDIFVDGGIRRHTVPEFALAGADGVIPGSLVLGDGDPNAVLNWIRNLAGTARSETA